MEDDSRIDNWKHVAKSDKLLKKYAGDVFSETRIDDGLHDIVDSKYDPPAEKELAKQQKTFGAVGHLTLQAMEGYAKLYSKLADFVLGEIGDPNTENPDYTGEGDTEHPELVYSAKQIRQYESFQEIHREFQVDVEEPIANVARIAAGSFTNSLDKRREKVIDRIRSNNKKAAAAITRIPPSSFYMFGGDHSQLAKVVELAKDLSNTADIPTTIITHPSRTRTGVEVVVEATMEVDTMTVTMGDMDLGAVEPVEAIEVVRTRDPEVEEEVHPFVGETPPGVEKLLLRVFYYG